MSLSTVSGPVVRAGASAGEAGGTARPAADVAPGPVRVPEPGMRARWSSRLAGAWALPLYLVLQAAQLLVLKAVAPRFFWIDDAQIQFTPMSWWLGRNFDGGAPPLLDPDQGMSGNLTADMQYGVLDVIRWPFLLFAGQQDDLQMVATTQAWISILALGTAALCLLRIKGVGPVLAVAGALGVATSSFMVWWGSAWSPLMWSIAALVWLWAALSSRRWYAPLGVGLASAAVVCAGNPYILPMVPLLLGGHVVERWRESGRAVLRSREAVATGLALLAGAALSVPTLVNALDVAQWMWRPAPEYTVASPGGSFNLLDIVVGGTTQLMDNNTPMFGTLVFSLPLLALVDWKRALRQPGVLTAGVMLVVALAITQLPPYFLGFRGPFRLLVVIQVTFGLLAVLAFAHARLVDRRRVFVAAGLVLLQAGISFSRSPVLWRWHAMNLVLVAAAVVAVVALVVTLPSVLRSARVRRWVRPVAAVAVVALSASPLIVQLGMLRTVQERFVAFEDAPEADVYRTLTNGYDVGTTVENFRDHAYATDTSLSVYAFGAFRDGQDRGWKYGVLGGNANLVADLRAGFGSLAVWPKGVQEHLKADYQSGLKYGQPSLMDEPAGADVPWIDLLSGNRVLLGIRGGDFVPEEVSDYFKENWELVAGRGYWREYERREPLPGRVSLVDDVDVQLVGPGDGLAHRGKAMETYTVSTDDREGTLVLHTAYWNGFRATLDGRPVEVSAFADALLQVEVPAGVSGGTLEIFFEPIGARLLMPCVALAGLLLAGSLVPVARARRQARLG